MQRTADRLLTRLGLRVQMRRGIFFEADVTTGAGQKPNLDELTFGAVDPALFETDPIFAEKGRLESFPVQASRGHRCYAFFDDGGALASYIWITGDVNQQMMVPFVFTGLKMAVCPGSAYIWNCFTAPQFRNRGLYRNGLRSGLAVCATEGIDRVYIACEQNNAASVKGILAAGFREKLRYGGLRLGSTCLLKRSDRRIRLARIGDTWDVLDGEEVLSRQEVGLGSRRGSEPGANQ